MIYFIKKALKKILPANLLAFYHYLWALFSACFYGFPGQSKDFIIIGVTGTSGKSTTVDFITRILEEDGKRVASFSSVRFKIGKEEWENKYKMTMPGRWVVQNFLKKARRADCRYVVIEVTSEGVKQFRHKFIKFDALVFTNLSPEHIESHGGFENYREAKLKLFRENPQAVHIINVADENAEFFWRLPARKKIGFKLKNQKLKCPLNNYPLIEAEPLNLINLEFEIGGQKFVLAAMGQFNIMNALASVAVAFNYGIKLEICSQALAKAKSIPGRMEVLIREPFMVVVDYAHTPQQLESVYQSLTSFLSEGKMICVLGSCGGGRDKWKRPVLGEIASRYCEKAIITNEDPYDEDPLEIINQVAQGAGEKAERILDRRQAIKRALALAQKGDVVVITGKGAEPWMCVANGKKIPWDDREIVKEELKEKKIKI